MAETIVDIKLHRSLHESSKITFGNLSWDIPVVCVNVKHDVDDSQTTPKYLFAKSWYTK